MFYKLINNLLSESRAYLRKKKLYVSVYVAEFIILTSDLMIPKFMSDFNSTRMKFHADLI